MYYVLTSLNDFITGPIEPVNLVKILSNEQVLENYLVQLRDKVKVVRQDLQEHTQFFRIQHHEQLDVDDRYNSLISLVEILLYYLNELNVGATYDRVKELKKFYNSVCYEMEELLLLMERNCGVGVMI